MACRGILDCQKFIIGEVNGFSIGVVRDTRRGGGNLGDATEIRGGFVLCSSLGRVFLRPVS